MTDNGEDARNKRTRFAVADGSQTGRTRIICIREAGSSSRPASKLCYNRLCLAHSKFGDKLAQVRNRNETPFVELCVFFYADISRCNETALLACEPESPPRSDFPSIVISAAANVFQLC